jgi:prepilin-type N-terminal cleavage/methylation domain-containing protein
MISRTHRGYSLVELVVSVAILGIILLGAQSAVMISSRAMPSQNAPVSRVIAAASSLDTFAKELTYAINIQSSSANSITFTVADRNADNQPETITYQWSGVSGHPLTRQYNGGTVTSVVPSVHSFALAYTKTAVAQSITYSESSETQLDSYTSSLGLSDEDVRSTNWVAQIFTPSLPLDATNWRVTRVFIRAEKRSGNTGVTSVQLRPVVAGAPSSSILAETLLYESTLPSNASWIEIPFTQAGLLGKSASLCLVLQWISDTESCRVQHKNFLLGSPPTVMLRGNGSSWTTSNSSLLYYVYGKVTTPNPVTYSYQLQSVRCTIQTTADTSSQLSTTILTLNQPQVAGP